MLHVLSTVNWTVATWTSVPVPFHLGPERGQTGTLVTQDLGIGLLLRLELLDLLLCRPQFTGKLRDLPSPFL